MKIIDLLNKIANGEEVPYKIRINDTEYLYDKYSNWYFYGKTSEDMFIDKGRLNNEVEIIEEEMCHKCHKYPVEHNQTYCEFCLGISKEEKKIPEKLDLSDYIEITSKNDMEYEMFEYIFNKNANSFFKKINDIIDYLKSKGE